MSTDRQIEANRLNAQHSTGPSTPEGRAAVRLNGLKYGLYAETLILPGEDPAEFDALVDRLDSEHQPATPTEELFVSQIAMASWRRLRVQRMEAAFYKNKHKEYTQDDNRWYRFRVRVTPAKIESWIDNDKVVDLDTTGKKIHMRFGEIEESEPFGLATYQTRAAIRNVRLRRLPSTATK